MNIHNFLCALIATLLLMFLITGCASEPALVKTEIKYVYIKPASQLHVKQSVSEPPNIESFLNANDSDRIILLSDYGLKLQKDILQCNDRIDSIYSNVDNQIKLIENSKKE